MAGAHHDVGRPEEPLPAAETEGGTHSEVVAPLRGGWMGGVVRAKAPHVGMSKGRDGEDGALCAGGEAQ